MESKHKKSENASDCIEALWKDGFFKTGQSLSNVSRRITEKWGHNFPMPDISNALTRASFIRRFGKRRSFLYIQKISPVSKRIENIEEQLFSDELVSKLGDTFKYEMSDLRHNFGVSGSCSAFILRKILEKLIYVVFAKNGLDKKIKDKNNPDRLLGLEATIDIVSKEKINGIPFLLPKTAEKIKGIKFLGDTSAHNPLVSVDMETIIPQMPYIITAYKELAERL